MTMKEVVETLEACGFSGLRPDPNGVTLGNLRFECGSGIAGRGGMWHLVILPSTRIDLGPWTTPGAMRRDLRRLFLQVVEVGRGVEALLSLPIEVKP